MSLKKSILIGAAFAMLPAVPVAAQSEIAMQTDTLSIRTVPEILEETIVTPDIPTFNRLLAPWVFTEYRALDRKKRVEIPSLSSQSGRIWTMANYEYQKRLNEEQRHEMDSIAERRRELDALWGVETTPRQEIEIAEENVISEPVFDQFPILNPNPRPQWLESAYEAWNLQEDMMYEMMVETPSRIEYAYWMLPVPPKLAEEDYSFHGFLKRNSVSGIDISQAVITEAKVEKKHWLHVINAALQFSQAYLSPNWYQGGNNHLALLANFLWDVQLNPVWHPDVLFQSTLSYKLGLNSVEKEVDQYRRYAISQDLFQYNVKFGYKARRNWYYSITGQFKTQLLNNYTKGTQTRIASFLTPGDLNFGLGMTYSKTNKAKTVQFNASIAPISYNLRTAIDNHVDHALFKMSPTAKFDSEVGSNAEVTFNWSMTKIISYKSRLFLFTDYKYGMGDWENTLNFQFSKLFSTQVFWNVRYDSSYVSPTPKENEPTDKYSKWGRWMVKEILSIGLSYAFSTK